MGTRKDIGKLFKERLGGIEQSPDAGLWDNIAAELDQTKGRRIAPFWYYFGSAIIIGALSLLWVAQPEEVVKKEKQSLVNSETIKDSDNVNIEDALTTTSKSTEDKNTTATTGEQGKVQTIQQDTTYNSQTAIIQSGLATNRPTINTISSSNKTNYSLIEIEALKNNSATVASNSNRSNKSHTPQLLYTSKGNEEALAKYKAEVKKALELEIAQQKEQAAIEVAAVIKKKTDSINKAVQKALTSNTKAKKKIKLPKTEEERAEDRKNATEYEIAISPYTSVLSYGSVSKGSSIDDRLVNNPRDAISTVGYGMRVDYTLGEKSSLRLGIGYAPLKYQTDNFQVSVTDGNINIYELSAINLANLNSGSSTESSPEAQSFFNANDIVSIEQNISYIEVPVGFQYRFINKRVSFSVNPGLSLLILSNNEIYATAASGQSIFVGRETNLNGLSLAFNFGLGGHYNINEKWRLNVEPVFRYQLNPYANNLSNFRPYYIGAQFGMSYKF